MVCNSLLIYYKEEVNGKKRLFSSISPSWRDEPNFLEYWKENNVTPKTLAKIDLVGTMNCDGRIICEVSAVDEPYYGGSSASLEIKYKCDKCGQTYFKHLPQNSSELSNFMTDKIGIL